MLQTQSLQPVETTRAHRGVGGTDWHEVALNHTNLTVGVEDPNRARDSKGRIKFGRSKNISWI